MSTTIIGTLVEIRDTFIVPDNHTHIMLPPGMKVDDLVVGERPLVTAKRQGRRWTAERIERYPG